MRIIIDTILVLVFSLSSLAQAQYIGSSRPPSRQEMLDSLAARPDTARFKADSLRLDSLASAGAAKDAALDTRIDSVRDNPSGGAGGETSFATFTITVTGGGGDFTGAVTQIDSLLQVVFDTIGSLGGGSVYVKGRGWQAEGAAYIQSANTTVTGGLNTSKIGVTGNGLWFIQDTTGYDHFQLIGIDFVGNDTASGIYRATVRADSGAVIGCRWRNFSDSTYNKGVFASGDSMATAWEFRNNIVIGCFVGIDWCGVATRIVDNFIGSPVRTGILIGDPYPQILNNRILLQDGRTRYGIFYSDVEHDFYKPLSSSTAASGFKISGNYIGYKSTSGGGTGITVAIASGTYLYGGTVSDNIIDGSYSVQSATGSIYGIGIYGGGTGHNGHHATLASGNIIRCAGLAYWIDGAGIAVTGGMVCYSSTGVGFYNSYLSVQGVSFLNCTTAVYLPAGANYNYYNCAGRGNGTDVSDSGTGNVGTFNGS